MCVKFPVLDTGPWREGPPYSCFQVVSLHPHSRPRSLPHPAALALCDGDGQGDALPRQGSHLPGPEGKGAAESLQPGPSREMPPRVTNCGVLSTATQDTHTHTHTHYKHYTHTLQFQFPPGRFLSLCHLAPPSIPKPRTGWHPTQHTVSSLV